jgi:hypothetical protein
VNLFLLGALAASILVPLSGLGAAIASARGDDVATVTRALSAGVWVVVAWGLATLGGWTP